MNAISKIDSSEKQKRRKTKRNIFKLRQIVSAIRLNSRRPTESGFRKAMQLLKEYSQLKSFKRSLAYRMRRIVRKENSFLLGFSEAIMSNFDYIFRYLYAAAFLLLIAG